MSNRSRTERFSRTPGPFRVRVIGRRTVDGLTYYTAVNPRTAEVYPWCVLLSGAGGSATCFLHAPVDVPNDSSSPFDGPEALLTFDAKGAAYLSGLSPAERQEGLSGEAPELEEADSHPATFTPRDWVIANGKARVMVDANGDVLVKACRSLRLQVGDDEGEAGRVLVFSTEGETLSEVVLYDPLRNYIVETLKSKVDELSQRLADITAAMASAGSSTSFANPFTGGALNHSHAPLAEPTAALATPFLNAPQRPGTTTKEAWDD